LYEWLPRQLRQPIKTIEMKNLTAPEMIKEIEYGIVVAPNMLKMAYTIIDKIVPECLQNSILV
jgi:hypothetical protein